MSIVVALGGNALLHRGERPEANIQQANIDTAAAVLAPLARDHDLIITHGNGPQVGLLAVKVHRRPRPGAPVPTRCARRPDPGYDRYWLLPALAPPSRPAVGALISRTVVSADDPAIRAPTKFVGPVYTARPRSGLAQAQRLADAPRRPRRGGGSSPLPSRSRSWRSTSSKDLLGAGATVICAGGGGIPVTVDAAGGLRGIEAVIDKDLTAALVAIRLHADMLLIMTDVDGVVDHYGTPQASLIRHRATPAQLRERPSTGSMGPKVEAACRFVEATGRPAAIGRLDSASALVAGTAGTLITAVVLGDRQDAAGRVPAART